MDKRTNIDDAIAEIEDGMTIGVGGWGSRRKPMALVRALARSGRRDLTLVTYGGPDVGWLCAVGAVRRVVTGFVSLDSIPLEPHWRAAREAGRVALVERDEGMIWWGLYAAANRLPFLPIRAGLGSDVLRLDPSLRTVTSPYDDGETLIAVPATPLDVALLHVNRADASGNLQVLGPDAHFDELFAGAARRVIASCEAVVATSTLREHPPATVVVNRTAVHAVVEAPRGAHFTANTPDYGRDEAFQRVYAAAAKDPAAWEAFRARYVDVDEATYQRAVAP